MSTRRSPKPSRRDKSARGEARVLSITATVGGRFVPFIEDKLNQALGLIPRAPLEVSLALVNDARMSELHEQVMGIPGPTDVLTFELDHGPRGHVISGEVVVCVPEARRRAKELGHKLEHELLLYALHGILHLSGHDDRTTPAYRRMHKTEDRILTRLGVGAVFAAKEEKV